MSGANAWKAIEILSRISNVESDCIKWVPLVVVDTVLAHAGATMIHRHVVLGHDHDEKQDGT